MRPRTLYHVMALIALAFVLFESKAHGQLVPVQCGPGGCPQCCPPQQYYYQPQRQPPRQRISPDGVETPPVGSPGTPRFECLPVAPPVQTPPLPPQQPPAPTIDTKALEQQQKEIIELLKANLEKQEQSILVQQSVASSVSNLTIQQLTPPSQPATKPFFIRVRNPKSGAVTEYAQVNQGQYVTIDLEPTSVPGARSASTERK
jgi:hypothetical protein